MADSLIQRTHRFFTTKTPVPSLEQTRQLWDNYCMLDNIRRHSEVVAAVGLLLCDWLEEAGLRLRRDAVKMGALLHDIAKTFCLGTERRHDLEGQHILVKRGFPEIGYLIGKHVYLEAEAPLDEIMIVNYADKRVNHEEVVNLNTRWTYIADRYGRDDPERLARIEIGRCRSLEMEHTIFQALFYLHLPDEIFRSYKDRL